MEPQEATIAIPDYFDLRIPLIDRFRALCDTEAFPNHQAKGINRAILCFVLKYLAEYLEIPPRFRIELLKEEVKRIVDERSQVEILLVLAESLEGQAKGWSDIHGIQCLSDIRSTAALVKEIAFNPEADSLEGGPFVSADLGSGTGILSAAAAIHGIRNKAREVLCTGIECQSKAVSQSMKILQTLDGATFQMVQGDLRITKMYADLFSWPMFVNYWISETFTLRTHEMIITSKGRLSLPNMKCDKADHFEINRRRDPLIHVFRGMLTVPQFFERVKNEDTHLFPNIILDHYRPHHERGGTIRLLTGQESHIPLHQVGQDFSSFEEFDAEQRWPEEKEEDKQKIRDLIKEKPQAIINLLKLLREQM